MTTVALSIFDFLAIHQKQTCRECGGLVDCVRLTKRPQRRGARLFFDDTTRSETCPECQIKAADEVKRFHLQADFDVMRAMRSELELGDAQAETRVREALHIRDIPTTTLWVEQAAIEQSALVADVYTVLGDGVGLPSEAEAAAWFVSLSRFPAFSLYFAEPPDFPGVAFVALAANIWHPKIPGAAVHLRWSPSDPLRYTMTVVGWGSIKRGNLKTLVDQASLVFDRWMPKSGRDPDNINEVCAEFERRLPAAIRAARGDLESGSTRQRQRNERRTPSLTQEALAWAFGWDEKTLRDRLHRCEKPWAKVKRMQGSRTIARP
jgi:hypothetical protein